MKSYNRLDYIDIMKGILIIFVILGHSNLNKNVVDLIFCFHMPVFFIVSGYLCKEKSDLGYTKYFGRQIKKYMIPYIFYYIACAIVYEDYNFAHLLKCIYGGKAIGGVYWFITVLLLVKCIYFCFIKDRSNQLKLLLIFLLYIFSMLQADLWGELFRDKMLLPWNIDIVPISLVYYYLGIIIRKREYSIQLKEKKILVLLSLITIIIFIYLKIIVQIDYTVDMKYGAIGKFGINILIPFCFFFILKEISIYLEQYKLLAKVFLLCGTQSLTVMYLHILIRDKVMISIFENNYNTFLYVLVVLFISFVVNVVVKHLTSSLIICVKYLRKDFD